MNIVSCTNTPKTSNIELNKIIITHRDTQGNSIRSKVLKDYCHNSMKYYIQSIHFPLKKAVDSLRKNQLIPVSTIDVLSEQYQDYNTVVDSIVNIKTGHTVDYWLK